MVELEGPLVAPPQPNADEALEAGSDRSAQRSDETPAEDESGQLQLARFAGLRDS